MRAHTGRFVILTGIFALALGAGAQAPPARQSQPAQAPAKQPAKKPKKVWTEDDLESVRKPSDQFVDQKSAEEQGAKEAEAKAKADAALASQAPAAPKIDPKTGKPIIEPDSPEDFQNQITNWEDEVKRTEQMYRDAREKMTKYSGIDEVRYESMRQEADIYSQNVIDLRKKIEGLKVKLGEAQKNRQAAPKPAAAPPPAEQPPPPTPPPPA